MCEICTCVSYLLFIDTYAMAGMALQCVKDAGSHVHNAAELDVALSKIKQKLLAARRTDGHIGNEFSTGLAVQVRIFFPSFHCLFQIVWNKIFTGCNILFLFCFRPY